MSHIKNSGATDDRGMAFIVRFPEVANQSLLALGLKFGGIEDCINMQVGALAGKDLDKQITATEIATNNNWWYRC